MTDTFYTCSYSRATMYYIGAAIGVPLGSLIMLLDITTIWKYGVVVSTVAFFGGCALYYDLKMKKRGDAPQDKIE